MLDCWRCMRQWRGGDLPSVQPPSTVLAAMLRCRCASLLLLSTTFESATQVSTERIEYRGINVQTSKQTNIRWGMRGGRAKINNSQLFSMDDHRSK